MTQTEAIAAIGQLVKEKKIFKNSNAYKSAIEAISKPGFPVICGEDCGSGRFASSKSWKAQTENILRLAGLEFTSFNIAPRGGKAGDRIAATMGRIKELVDEYKEDPNCRPELWIADVPISNIERNAFLQALKG